MHVYHNLCKGYTCIKLFISIQTNKSPFLLVPNSKYQDKNPRLYVFFTYILMTQFKTSLPCQLFFRSICLLVYLSVCLFPCYLSVANRYTQGGLQFTIKTINIISESNTIKTINTNQPSKLSSPTQKVLTNHLKEFKDKAMRGSLSKTWQRRLIGPCRTNLTQYRHPENARFVKS